MQGQAVCAGDGIVTIHFSEALSEPDAISRCRTVAKTARSTGNSKRRSASSASITALQPVSSHKRPNSSGAPMRLASTRGPSRSACRVEKQQHLLAVSRSRPDTLAITVQVELGTGYRIGDAATGAPGRP